MAKKDSVVTMVVAKALQDNPGYGLVITGHSLGAGVAALMALEWASPEPASPLVRHKAAFPSSARLTRSSSGLPAGRPIHCYAFGSPCVGNIDLCKDAHGLVTSLVHGDDIFATLSRGLIRDVKAIALRLLDNKGLCERVISRTLGLYSPPKSGDGGAGLRATAGGGSSSSLGGDGNEEGAAADPPPVAATEDEFFWELMVQLRKSMRHERLYPVGVTFWLYHAVTVAKDARTGNERTISRVSLQRCDDLADVFNEPHFSARVISDHMPLSYEAALDALLAAMRKERDRERPLSPRDSGLEE
ncbi:hypothetical protein HK405_010609 [Cladochytrium tenue]|nr:hypothetical protein HK405_010609 [Cladochytrium tenue]